MQRDSGLALLNPREGRALRDRSGAPDSDEVCRPLRAGRASSTSQSRCRDGGELRTLLDAGRYVDALPRSMHEREEHMSQCMSDALKAHAPPLSGLAKLSAPLRELILDRILAEAPQPLNLLRAWRARTCGYVDNARALPTYPQAQQQKQASTFHRRRDGALRPQQRDRRTP
jgi:hypothetical protein